MLFNRRPILLTAKIKTGIQGEIREFLKLFGLTVFAQRRMFSEVLQSFFIFIFLLLNPKKDVFTILTRKECMKTKKNVKKTPSQLLGNFLDP